MQILRRRLSRFMRPELALVAGLLFVYNVNLRQVSSFDTYASRLAPISLLRDGDLVLDEFFPDAAREEADAKATGTYPAIYNYLVPARGHYYDSHPPVGPLLALPVYALPVWAGIPADPVLAANLFSKIAASLLAALSALAIFAVVRRALRGVGWCPGRERDCAILAALVYGLATPVWSTASQAMWSHTPTVFGYAVALWALVAGWMGLAGAAASAAVIARPATAPAAGLLVLYSLHVAWRTARCDGPQSSTSRAAIHRAIRCCGSAAAVGAIGAAYNWWLFGNLVGGAPLRTSIYLDEFGAANMFSGSLFSGLAGLTVSPSRGLLVFSPILVLAVIGAVAVWRPSSSCARARGQPGTAEAWLLGRYACAAGLAVLLTYAKFIAWWGGHGFGPRYLADAMPFFGLLVGFGLAHLGSSAAVVLSRRRLAAITLIVLFAYSSLVQAVGAFCWPSPWTLNDNPRYYYRLWDWRDSQIVMCIRSGPRLDPAAQRLLARLGLSRSTSPPTR